MTAPLEASERTPAGPRRQQRGIRFPQLLLSLLVVGVFALLAVWWQASTTARTPVVALANDVDIGVPLVRSDLTEIYISADISPAVTGAQFADNFVGAVPTANLRQGTLITGEMFRPAEPLAGGQAFVGLLLDPNRAPRGLVVGDRVQVLTQEPGTGEVRILSPDARVDFSSRNDDNVTLRLRMAETDARSVQVRANSVVVIEVNGDGDAPWENGVAIEEEDGS